MLEKEKNKSNQTGSMHAYINHNRANCAYQIVFVLRIIFYFHTRHYHGHFFLKNEKIVNTNQSKNQRKQHKYQAQARTFFLSSFDIFNCCCCVCCWLKRVAFAFNYKIFNGLHHLTFVRFLAITLCAIFSFVKYFYFCWCIRCWLFNRNFF